MSAAVERKWFEAVASIEHCVLCGAWGVQVSHSNQGRGMGQRSPPWETAALCPEHHHEIDNGKNLDQSERRAMHDRSIVKTHSKLIESGRLKLT